MTDIASQQETLRTWMEDNAEVVEQTGLVIGFGYDNGQLAELRHPTVQELDAVSTEVPILIVHQSSHLGVANSKALEFANIADSVENPDGGVFQRDETGALNGVMEEYAFYAVMLPLLSKLGPDAFDAFAEAGSDLWASYGYTSAQ